MLKKTLKILATKIFLVLLLFGAMPISTSFGAGIPVVDVSNLGQNTIAAIENIAQTLKQLEEYSTQLQQYEDQLRNTMAPAAYIWDQAQTTMNKVTALQSKLQGYYSQAGNLDSYLMQMGNVDYWKGSDYYKLVGGGTKQQAQQARKIDDNINDARLAANKDFIQSMEFQRQQLEEEARKVTKLQSQATSAQGRMEAIQASNQFLSQQSAQLLQIKAIMTVQGNAVAQSLAAQQAKDARQKAAEDSFFEGNYRKIAKPDYNF